jgi:DNA/RNA-binding domain of Phe-tRNA-synthetase-like protein
LLVGAFTTVFPKPLAESESPSWLRALLSPDAAAPVRGDESVRQTIRSVLRHGGYKQTGRGKPASEYLLRAASSGELEPINVAVDVCNVVSLHSGLPISIVDLALARAPLEIAVVRSDVRYPFNASGQEIRVEGLVCLHDRAGPCANGVKDSERTKTRGDTVHTLTVVWGARSLAAHTESAVGWYRELLARVGATTELLATSS